MVLNGKQRFILVLGGFAVLVMLLFPPWLYTLDVKGGTQELHIREDAGYALIFEPPKPDDARKKGPLTQGGAQLGLVVVRIDIVRLLIQVAAAGMGTLILMFLFHHRKAVTP